MSSVFKFLKGWATVGLLLLVFVFTGCEMLEKSPANGDKTGVSNSVNPAVGAGQDDIQKGQKITIEFNDVNPPPLPVQVLVREDGMISLPYNISLMAAGKTFGALSREIELAYVPKIYRRLTINIKAEDRIYTVSGEVRTPGTKIYLGQTTVLKAISSAGDYTDFANKTNIELTRADGKKFKINGKKALKNPELDLPVYPGDNVHVDRRFF